MILLKVRNVNKYRQVTLVPQPLKAVVIEDDHDLQYLYQLKLENAGFSVKTANNGEDGLRITEEFAPDVILLDLMMPVMGFVEMI
jgi:two-component system, OmpR family, alkaline phosphatase synthesis response regulator PhoP